MVSLQRGRAVMVGLLCWLAGCSGGSAESPTIRRAERLTLYEGLPHPFYESAALATEKKTKPVIELHDFPFYREPLDLKGGDDGTLRALLGDPQSFTPFSDEKKCGGFHPDYAVEWSAGGADYACLICFGCGEVKIYGPQGETRYDIRSDARKPLQDLLKPYRKNRPHTTPSAWRLSPMDWPRNDSMDSPLA